MTTVRAIGEVGRKRAVERAGTAAACRFLKSTVLAAFDLDEGGFAHPNRGEARLAFARQVAMYVAHTGLGLSLTEIGRHFARDRTTVAHACRLVEERRDDPKVELIVEAIEFALRTWKDRVRTGEAA